MRRQKNRLKQMVSWLLVVVMLLTTIPINAILAFADTTIKVTQIEYVRQHDKYQFLSAGITITGRNLNQTVVEIFDTDKNIWVTDYGTRNNIGTQRVTISFTQAEAQNFSGRVAVHTDEGVIEYNLNTVNFPNLTGGTPSVNIDDFNDPPVETQSDKNIVFTGTNLSRILSEPDITATFGSDSPAEFTVDNFKRVPAATGPWQLIQPNPGRLGNQNIDIERNIGGTGSGENSDAKVITRYFYRNAFRTLRNTRVVGDIELFPNIGINGDTFYLRADNIPGGIADYDVHFLTTLDGSDPFSPQNKATILSISAETDSNNVLTGKFILRGTVPMGLGAGPYRVVLVDKEGTQVVSETFVDQYTIVETDRRPIIRRLSPNTGSDVGETTDIIGDYLLTLSMPGLEGGTNRPVNLNTATWGQNSKKLRLRYDNTAAEDNYTFNGIPVLEIHREIEAIVGGEVTFHAVPTVGVGQGRNERIPVSLEPVQDAATNPKRNAVVDILTTITVQGGVQYQFTQQIRLDDAYTFIPSTYDPEITEILPDVIQIKNEPIDTDVTERLNELANDVLIGIKGENFFVDRFVDDSSGELVIRYPEVLIKTGTSDDPTVYELAFKPNAGDGGEIWYFDPAAPPGDPQNGYRRLNDPQGQAITFQMIVLNQAGREVNGTTGNELGTKMIIRMPAESLINLQRTADVGLKRVQVTNPTRSSDEPGGVFLSDEILRFIRTTDVPVIQRVNPTVVTVEGNEEVVIVGSNFRDGMKLYLDGEQITNFTRERDISGGNDIVRFNAPPGREGVTQIAIVNPSGGMAVHDFTYVSSFQADPEIISFAPPQGTPGTLVVVNGRNFVLPDPTAPTETGIDAYRLLGTRIFLDGRDVNEYNLNPFGQIEFQDYNVPEARPLLERRAGQAAFSRYADNTTAHLLLPGGARNPVRLTNDSRGRPAFDLGDRVFNIRIERVDPDGTLHYGIYNAMGERLSDLNMNYSSDPASPYRGTTTFTFEENGTTRTIEAVTDNRLMRVIEDNQGRKIIDLANYVDAVQLFNPISKERFTLSYDFEGKVVLSDNKNRVYTLEPNLNGGGDPYIAREGAGTITFNVTPQGIQIRRGATTEILRMRTPYLVNDNGRIVGQRATVLNSGQIAFEVPVLTTGRGFKDLMVVNPDTKNDSRTGNNGFLYIPQSSSNPVISDIRPSRGSVDGGYYVTIYGGDFSDMADIYVDAVKVPREDIFVSLTGDEIRFRMPPSVKKLNEDFGVDRMTVPVVVLNPDGGSASRRYGFTYIIPKSSPVILEVMPDFGSANGGEIVEIIGDEFRFFEPFDSGEGAPYVDGDPFEDLNNNGQWDNLLAILDGVPQSQWMEHIKSLGLEGLLERHPMLENDEHEYYYTSPILPSVFFGNREGKIVEFGRGYIKVITPPHPAGEVELYIINNDSGVSNKVPYTFRTTNPTVRRLVPNFGRRTGQEPKDIFGSELLTSILYGYTEESVDPDGNVEDRVKTIGNLNHVDAMIRFGEIDNLRLDRVAPNSGLINNQRATVNLEGGLRIEYVGAEEVLRVRLEESNTVFTREFHYEGEDLLIPMGMLKRQHLGQDQYYVPFGYENFVDDRTVYREPYEYVRVRIEDRRLLVERGYAPKVRSNNPGHVVVHTPSYFTIGTVPMTYTNRDGGKVTVPFTYTNPASVPRIFRIEPQTISFNEDKWLVEGSVNGGIDIEIIGEDFRQGVEVYIGPYQANVKEVSTTVIDGVTYDLIVATVPQGTDDDIDVEMPIMVLNEDRGLATSSNIPDLIGPNFGEETLPIYFVYKKPLSGPRIDLVTPSRTSVAGGNPIRIVGSDFREGAYVIIGTRAGIPIYEATISERGTVIDFITPKDMTLGMKTVHVQNNDYGIAVRQNALEVISAPTVNPWVEDAEGNRLDRIHVTGGQKIILTGTGFMEGARVYFGGDYKTMQPGEDVPETEQGLYRDDSIRYVDRGQVAPTVEFVDSETLIVTTPEVTFEGKVTVVVRNPDSGISGGDTVIDYTVPIPSDPTGLRVTTVDKRYIKIYDYVADGSEYFEIFVYIGSKTNPQLIQNNYQDFSFIGMTNLEPYKISDVPGFDSMLPNERMVFVLKAANKFGPSNYSNLAWLTHEQLKEIEELGPPNLDGDIGVEPGETHRVVENGGRLQLDLAESFSQPSLYLDMRDRFTRGTQAIQVVMPENLVRNSRQEVTVELPDVTYRFSPVIFGTQTFRQVSQNDEGYARLTHVTGINRDQGHLAPSRRGMIAVSEVHTVTFDAKSNRETQTFNTLAGHLDVTFSFKKHQLSMARANQVQLYRFNERTGQYEAVPTSQVRLNTNDHTITARINQSGHYVLFTRR